MAPATFVAAILTYAWPFAKSKGAYVAIAILYGYVKIPSVHLIYDLLNTFYSISSGVYVSMLAAPTMAMSDMHNIGLRIGMSMSILAIGALAGPPISGAINQATGDFKSVGYYAGMHTFHLIYCHCQRLKYFFVAGRICHPHLRCSSMRNTIPYAWTMARQGLNPWTQHSRVSQPQPKFIGQARDGKLSQHMLLPWTDDSHFTFHA